jgi:uncharacterized membrane protein
MSSRNEPKAGSVEEARQQYWRANIRVILWSLVVWALVSFGTT